MHRPQVSSKVFSAFNLSINLLHFSFLHEFLQPFAVFSTYQIAFFHIKLRRENEWYRGVGVYTLRNRRMQNHGMVFSWTFANPSFVSQTRRHLLSHVFDLWIYSLRLIELWSQRNRILSARIDWRRRRPGSKSASWQSSWSSWLGNVAEWQSSKRKRKEDKGQKLINCHIHGTSIIYRFPWSTSLS